MSGESASVERSSASESKGRSPDVLAALDDMREEIERLGPDGVKHVSMFTTVKMGALSVFKPYKSEAEWVWHVTHSAKSDKES